MSERPGTLKKDLVWGQTPFDDMSRDELLFEVRRMFSALGSCKSALAVLASNDSSPYWSPDGTGGRALKMAEIALEGLDDGGEFSEAIYRMYYRYAIDLLFGPKFGFGWWVCDSCGDMWGDPDKAPFENCINQTCAAHGQPLRRLNWDDLKPEASDGDGPLPESEHQGAEASPR
jgi:hypothetical protein